MQELQIPLEPIKPNIYSYTDYRRFLLDSFKYLKFKNSHFTESAFLKKACFGSNSRGYLNLICQGKRNLSSRSILGFGKALNLNPKEMNCFENLVYYNQAKDDFEKKHYYERLIQSNKTQNPFFELLKSQYNYYSNWYLVVIRELVNLKDFKEDDEWIVEKLKHKITKKQVQEGINDLLRLGLLKRNEQSQLIQSSPNIDFTDNAQNHGIVKDFHAQMLSLTKEALLNEPYHRRSTSCATLACNAKDFQEIKIDIENFEKHIIEKYGHDISQNDSILHLGIQLCFLNAENPKNHSERNI